jgi:SAM-dependent methyltransferase
MQPGLCCNAGSVIAVENNPFMWDKLYAKNLQKTGRLTLCLESAEDIDLVQERNLDAAVAVNCVYALEDPAGWFRKVAQILKSGGVIAVSTTHSETRLDPLLESIERELKANGTFRAKEEHYHRVVAANKDIEPLWRCATPANRMRRGWKKPASRLFIRSPAMLAR